MTDCDYKCRCVAEDFDLSPSDRDFVLRLLDVSRVSLASNPEPDSEPTPDHRGPFPSKAQSIRSETSSITSKYVISEAVWLVPY